ncbi:hypothetical protein [Tepidibacter mesophilus]|uniref:hypothetical protein n=1 Tax=Tepidibacter mesophilus TaxID=655607 RepID=UPI000C08101F|nr:hypothetical protein [Tepidibacter mesophilus]
MKFTKMELWGTVLVKNERLGTDDDKVEKIKDIFAELISDRKGSIRKVGGTDVTEVITTQKIKVRRLSIKEPKIDMFFKNQNLKYEVLEFFPYSNNGEQYWMFNTKIVHE